MDDTLPQWVNLVHPPPNKNHNLFQYRRCRKCTFSQRNASNVLSFDFCHSKSEKWKKRHKSILVDYDLFLKPEAQWPFDNILLHCVKIHFVETTRKKVAVSHMDKHGLNHKIRNSLFQIHCTICTI